jgi:hypothetical protein
MPRRVYGPMTEEDLDAMHAHLWQCNLIANAATYTQAAQERRPQ